MAKIRLYHHSNSFQGYELKNLLELHTTCNEIFFIRIEMERKRMKKEKKEKEESEKRKR